MSRFNTWAKKNTPTVIKPHKTTASLPKVSSLLFVTLVVISSSLSTILQPTLSSAASASSLTSLDNQIIANLYRNALATCIKSAPLKDDRHIIFYAVDFRAAINEGHAINFEWFSPGSAASLDVIAGPVLNSSYGSKTVSKSGIAECGNAAFITEALTKLGYDAKPGNADSAFGLLCDFGFRREGGDGCKTGNGDWQRPNSGDATYAAFMKTPNANVANLSDEAKYVLIKSTFMSLCSATENKIIPDSSLSSTTGIKIKSLEGTDKNSFTMQDHWYTYGDTSSRTPWSVAVLGLGEGYDIGITNLNNIFTFAPGLLNIDGGPRGNSVAMGRAYIYASVIGIGPKSACGALGYGANLFANAYLMWAKANDKEAQKIITSTKAQSSTDTASTSCAIEGIGWLVCPVMKFLGSVADGMYGIIEGLLVTNVKVIDFKNGTYTAWQAMRSIANVGFVIMFLIIIFSQLSSVGISNYGVKKILPRLIVVAILVNVSYLISQLAVDLSNILGGSLKTFLDGIPIFDGALDGNVLAKGNWITNIAAGWITGAATAIGTIGVTTAAYYGGIGLLLPVILVAVVAILMTLFVLIARQALIILLVVVSPLAFLAMLLPNTEAFFKKWRKAFVALLLVYPAIALLFGGARLASGILAQTLTGPMGSIVSLAVMVLPLFFVPALLKGSLNAIPAIGGLAQKLSSGASRGTRSLGKKGTDYLGQRAASGDSKFAKVVSKSLQGNGMYGKRRQAAARRNYREPRIKDLMEGWSNDGTADNYGELEKIAGQNPSSFQGQAALQILASKSETETLQRIRQNMTDPEQIMAYNKAIQSNYGTLKARDPRAVKSGDALVEHFNKITQEQLHAMSPEAREAGIALSGGGGSQYSATLAAAMSDPLQSRFFNPKELGRQGGYAQIPGGQSFNQPNTVPSVPSVPQKTEAPIDPAWAAWHTEGKTSQTVINIDHNGEATVGVAPQPQDAQTSQTEAKSAAIAEAKRLKSAAGNQDIHTDERGRSVPGSKAGGGDDDDYRRGMSR